MRRLLAALAAACVAVAVPPLGHRPARAAVSAQLVVDCQPPSDTCWPAAFAFTPNGRELFYLERFTGEIHRVKLRNGRDTTWGQVGPVQGGGEQGALGLALDPKWNKGKKKKRKKNRWVYVFYTDASPRENRIVRLRKRRNRPGVIERHLLTVPINTGATNHNAGPMAFGPDNKLFVVTGDQGQPSRSQDTADPAGKVLRMNRNGGRPADNPIPGSRAFSFGHRNSFGLGFDPLTGNLWQTENGPDCDDELNRIVAGGNYGWGAGSSCPNTSTQGPSPIPAEFEYTPPVVPTGLAFCAGCGLGADVEGDLLVGLFGDGTEIRRYDLDGERDDITTQAALYDHPSGVLAMARRRNGQVWFSDSGGIYRLTGP